MVNRMPLVRGPMAVATATSTAPQRRLRDVPIVRAGHRPRTSPRSSPLAA